MPWCVSCSEGPDEGAVGEAVLSVYTRTCVRSDASSVGQYFPSAAVVPCAFAFPDFLGRKPSNSCFEANL